jgi:hypothetical protein
MKEGITLLKVVFLSLLVAGGLFLLLTKQDDSQKVGKEMDRGGPSGLELKLRELSDDDFDWIAARIYQNEAMGQSRYLTFWGEGEDFPSFGIGHFIWFPAGVDAPFDEMFPQMASFVREHSPDDISYPPWMAELTPFDAPWSDKQQFDEAWSSPEMTQLRHWLEVTGHYQARFIVATFEQRWRGLELPAEQKQPMTALLQRLATSAEGLFAIIDYYNFKGLGNNPRERYQDQGWGLIQVLQETDRLDRESGGCEDLVELFRRSAANRLSLRVELSPPERGEERWLEGWLNRLQGYVERGPGFVSFFGPGFRVKPYLQNPAGDAVTLMWLSNENQAGQVQLWKSGDDGNSGSRTFESSPAPADTLNHHPAETASRGDCPVPAAPYLHEVRFNGLEPGNTYHYEVKQDDDHAEGNFQTSPPGDDPNRTGSGPSSPGLQPPLL